MEHDIIKREIDKKGGVTAVAQALQVSTAAVYYWLNGKRRPSYKLLAYLGLEQKIRFVRRERKAGQEAA